MDRLLARLERRFGKYAFENLPIVIVGMTALALLMTRLKPEFESMLVLDPYLVMHGQPWRLVTFLFVPPHTSLIFAIFAVLITWTVASGLESAWGAFKFNLFYVIGMLGTIAGAWIAHAGAGNLYLNMSLFLAFATVFPDYEFQLFLFFPVKVKWLALLDAVLLAFTLATGDWAERAAILASVGNYLLFFSGTLLRARPGVSSARAAAFTSAARASVRPSVRPGADGSVGSEATAFGHRTCAICGANEEDGADIRVCSCEKCGGTQRTLCLPHARAH